MAFVVEKVNCAYWWSCFGKGVLGACNAGLFISWFLDMEKVPKFLLTVFFSGQEFQQIICKTFIRNSQILWKSIESYFFLLHQKFAMPRKGKLSPTYIFKTQI